MVLWSVTEGEDKPIKYPHMFSRATTVVLGKTDLLPHVPFDVGAALDFLRQVNPRAPCLQVSARTGAGMRELEALVKNGLTQQQFEDTRNFLSKYVLHYAETTSRRLAYAIDDRYYGIGGEGHLALARKMLKELTLDEVNAAIRKHLKPADMWVAMVTEHAEDLKKALASEAPSPFTYGEGIVKPAEQLAEDQAIATYPLHLKADRIAIVPVTKMFE